MPDAVKGIPQKFLDVMCMRAEIYVNLTTPLPPPPPLPHPANQKGLQVSGLKGFCTLPHSQSPHPNNHRVGLMLGCSINT